MKKQITATIIFVISFINLHAQPFGANGASWVYSYSTWSPPYQTLPVYVTSSGPIVIGNDTCYDLGISGQTGCATLNSMIVTQRGDSVFYFSQILSDFTFLYNYNAAIGDTQEIRFPGSGMTDTSIQQVVIDTGSININGFWKRTYTVQQTTWYFAFGGMVIEDIGTTGFLFPQFGFCDPLTGSIRCYEDSIVGLYNFNPSVACDSVINVGIGETENESELFCYPNPFTSLLTIFSEKLKFKDTKVAIYNTLGKEVSAFLVERQGFDGRITIDLSKLNSGIYFLHLSSEGSSAVKRILKE